jgi:hypothetical protein
MLINPRHEAFAVAVAATGSISEAARAAGYTRHVSSRGSDPLRRPEVKQRVETLVAQRLSTTGQLAPQVIRHLPPATGDAVRQLAETVLRAFEEPASKRDPDPNALRRTPNIEPPIPNSSPALVGGTPGFAHWPGTPRETVGELPQRTTANE